MIEQLTDSLNFITYQTKLNAPTLELVLGIPWLVFIITLLTGRRLLLLGIMPRRLYGLPGIVCAPFLHANLNHIFFNSIPLLVLSDFLLLKGIPYFLHITIYITLLSGILIWCFAKPGLHVGASAVITGYWALLVSDIYQQGTFVAVILGIISLYYFAGIFYGIIPGKKGVSWEGHLFGLLAGLIVSYLGIQ